MEIVTEHTIVEVGKFYKVKCAVYVEYDGTYIDTVPVIGEPHKDKQFSVDYLHYHIDGRFIKTNHPYFPINNNGRTNAVLSVSPSNKYWARVKEVVFKKIKCKRVTTGIIPPANAKKYFDWKATMIGKSCEGKKCPHLGTIMQEINGRLVCPLHNLIGCIETQKIIE